MIAFYGKAAENLFTALQRDIEVPEESANAFKAATAVALATKVGERPMSDNMPKDLQYDLLNANMITIRNIMLTIFTEEVLHTKTQTPEVTAFYASVETIGTAIDSLFNENMLRLVTKWDRNYLRGNRDGRSQTSCPRKPTTTEGRFCSSSKSTSS